jgi:hypothetical protein
MLKIRETAIKRIVVANDERTIPTSQYPSLSNPNHMEIGIITTPIRMKGDGENKGR